MTGARLFFQKENNVMTVQDSDHRQPSGNEEHRGGEICALLLRLLRLVARDVTQHLQTQNPESTRVEEQTGIEESG
jgi:hypothetical protein